MKVIKPDSEFPVGKGFIGCECLAFTVGTQEMQPRIIFREEKKVLGAGCAPEVTVYLFPREVTIHFRHCWNAK
jgi:hypothetical protein